MTVTDLYKQHYTDRVQLVAKQRACGGGKEHPNTSNITANGKIPKAIFSTFYNVSEQNFAISPTAPLPSIKVPESVVGVG